MPFVPVPQKKRELYKPSCFHPEHNPPSMIVLSPGPHTWVCPGCGERTTLVVPEIRCGA